MLNVEVHNEESIIAIKASKSLSQSDFDDLIPILKDFVQSTENPNLLMILEKFKGWDDTSVFWKDLKLDAKYIGTFDRIAIVSESKWQERGTKLVDLITKNKLKFYPVREADKAWFWLNENVKPV